MESDILAHAARRKIELLIPELLRLAQTLAGTQTRVSSTRTMSLAAGTRLGRYEIHSLIGEGGMGEVYLAEDEQLERTVALKVLHEEVASDPQRMRRFVQEAKTTSALNHPNILTVHEVGQAASVHFIATEFIDGITLRERVMRGKMETIEALDVALQVAAALTAAHEAGIIHRDIKPENIMLRRDGYVKVLDFGIAKLTEKLNLKQDDGQETIEFSRRPAPVKARPSNQGSDSDEAPTIFHGNTETGVLVGTARYMSPEQARGFKVDARTDIFSFGAVLYEESLTLCREMGDKRGVTFCLEGLAEVACTQNAFERAARLFGAAEALREAIKAPLPLVERADYERNVKATRAGLNEETFTDLWAQGREMNLEEAIAYALELPEEI